MQPSDELCLCFHVTRRKVENYIRLEKPRRVGQLADCYGAGTGCGWCRPFLERLFEAAQAGNAQEVELPSPEQYASERSDYVSDGRGTPPPVAG
ncbi:MAG: (2Fe-2S)-binding protein [Lacipirellulaceae bacterium]